MLPPQYINQLPFIVMEHGFITATRYDSGVVICDVQAIRVSTEYESVPMLKPMSALAVVPRVGQKVAMQTLSDGTRFVSHVVATEDDAPASMNEGEISFQLDAETKLMFTEDGSGNYDVNVSASGKVFINGIDFDAHTHDYDDETISDTGDGTGSSTDTTRTTGPPQ